MRQLTTDRLNPAIRDVEYAVRGELAIKAEAYREKLKEPNHGLPFQKVISSNIGNPQQKGLDQPPITFVRQVAALMEWPALAELAPNVFPPDVVARAKELQSEIGSVGAYSHSMGVPFIRKNVAKFIEARDGYPSDPNHIFLTAGASAGVSLLISMLLTGPKSGILIPIPQYPLYTATIAAQSGAALPYLLDESHDWATSPSDIDAAVQKAARDGIEPKALVVINPGNPTGASLSKEDINAVLTLAAKERLVVIADEVYQTNVFIGEFHSFKKCLRELQADPEVGHTYADIELASLHSISKGMIGECGQRGGYFELVGFDPEVEAQIFKFISIMLCPPVLGQCMVDCMVNPPREGEPSFELYKREYAAIYKGLKDRATALYEAFKQMEGVHCQEPQGAMYLFPTITLPEKAIAAAQAEKRKPDEFYCLRLLDATGVCVVPGSGFGQKEGTLHFRTTFLAPGTQWVSRITEFHSRFMDEYR